MFYSGCKQKNNKNGAVLVPHAGIREYKEMIPFELNFNRNKPERTVP